MADKKQVQVSQINFDYNGKHYCLEYNREAVKRMEAAGFKPGESGSTPLIELDMLWAGAFYKNHRKESSHVIEQLLDKMENKDELLNALRDMVAETYTSLMGSEEGDEGNVKWTATR
jgi:hypothetical protein